MHIATHLLNISILSNTEKLCIDVVATTGHPYILTFLAFLFVLSKLSVTAWLVIGSTSAQCRSTSECTEMAVPDLWNVWGRVPEGHTVAFLISYSPGHLNSWKCSFVGFPSLFCCFCDISWFVEFPVFQFLLNFYFYWISRYPVCWISRFFCQPLYPHIIAYSPTPGHCWLTKRGHLHSTYQLSFHTQNELLNTCRT